MLRRRTGVLITLATLSLGFGVRQMVAQETAQKAVVRGEVVDLSCYMKMGEKGRGPEHKSCAVACVKGGLPVGLRELDRAGKPGRLCVDLGMDMMHKSGKDLKPHVGTRVEVTGWVIEKNGVRAIAADAVKTL